MKTNSSKKRPLELGLFIKLLEVYKTNLVWNHKSFTELLFDFDADDYDYYIDNVRNNIRDNDLYTAFILCDDFKQFHLIESDVTILSNFLKNVGKYGLDEEVSLCEKTLDFLTEQKNKAQQESEKQGKLYLKLAILFALWIIILLV